MYLRSLFLITCERFLSWAAQRVSLRSMCGSHPPKGSPWPDALVIITLFFSDWLSYQIGHEWYVNTISDIRNLLRKGNSTCVGCVNILRNLQKTEKILLWTTWPSSAKSRENGSCSGRGCCAFLSAPKFWWCCGGLIVENPWKVIQLIMRGEKEQGIARWGQEGRLEDEAMIGNMSSSVTLMQ